MSTNNRRYKAKALLCFCLFLSLSGLMAQNTGTYKYVLTPTDTFSIWNTDVLEINNHYYLLSHSEMQDYGIYPPDQITIVSVYDKDLNKIKEIPLYELGNASGAYKFFYDGDYFYIFGWITIDMQTNKPIFAKYDANFNLEESVVVYDLDDSLGYYKSDILMTSENEFLYMVEANDDSTGCLLRINPNGVVLQAVTFRRPRLSGSLVETDSFYIMNYMMNKSMLTFRKDSLEKSEWISIEWPYCMNHKGEAITVGNKLIRANGYWGRYNECPAYIGNKEYKGDDDIRIIFLNEDFSFKKELIFGNPCFDEYWGSLHYTNPDSIYYAYTTWTTYGYHYTTSTISIACFSSEGELHFNHMLDLPEEFPKLVYVNGCRATSDGGVLVWVAAEEEVFTPPTRCCLLKYHPSGNVGIAETHCNTSLRVYPNPTTGQLRVALGDISDGSDRDIQIYSVAGQVVGTWRALSLQDGTATIDISHLAKGMYFLRVGEKVVRFVRE